MTEHRLYLELLMAGGILLAILFINNIFLYKQKITDRISLMLIFGVIMSFCEILWSVCENDLTPGIYWLFYVGACGYCIAFVIFAANLNRYLIERIGLRIPKAGVLAAYVLPVAAFILVCLSTPLTRLMVWIDGNGVAHDTMYLDMILFWVVLAYLLSPTFIALYFVTLGRNRRPADGEISASMFVFSFIAIALYFLQLLLLRADSDKFITMSLPVSIALVYLITNVSTRTALENRAKVEAVESDLRIASRIQTDALPPVAPEFADHLELKLRCSMNTAKEVGGDFYDYFPIDDTRVCFLIADVSGKGTPAALFMMTAKTMIKDYALTLGSTSEIFNAVNGRLCENNETSMFATAWIGILDTRTMTLQYTNAGHNYPVLLRRGQPCRELKTVHGLFLAGMETTKYRQDELALEPGDRLLLYTDGVTEAHDRSGGLYGMERLEQVLDSTRDLPGEQVLKHISRNVDLFAAGTPQFDDITMAVLTISS